MRILIISNYYPPFEIGGWEQLTADVAAILETKGHRVHVLTSRYRADELSAAESRVERTLHLESPDHIHYHLNYTLQAKGWEQQNKQILARRASAFLPDIIFINGVWNLPRSLVLEAERLSPGRVVYYMASPWPAEPDAHSAYWQMPVNHLWRQVPKRLLRWLSERWLLPKREEKKPAFDLVLCVSEYMRGFIARECDIPLEQSRVVYNGIDPAVFTPKSAGFGNNRNKELRLFYAGQLRADKGVHTAVEAVGRFVQNNRSIPVTFTIYGGGAPEYIEGLRERIEALNLDEIVHLAGQIPRQEMPAVMAEHEVLLFPSIWPEPLARVVQEAMATGLVVIGTTTGGTPELLKEGETGLTFEAEDVDGLAGQIGRVANSPELRERLSVAAREKVESCFTQDRMVDEIESYFGKVLER